MPTSRKSFRRFTDRLNRRFRNARPGSVLILVVALLVLMALIGTAWLSTASSDRYTSQQNSINVEAEVMTEGVVAMAKAAYTSDVISGSFLRPADSGYGPHDSAQVDDLFGSRVPVQVREVAQAWGAYDTGRGIFVPARRQYEAGQMVSHPISGSVLGYFLCLRSHIIHTTAQANLPSLADSTTPNAGAAAGYWIQVGSDASSPPFGQTVCFPFASRLLAGVNFVDISNQIDGFDRRTYLFPDTVAFAGNPYFPAFRYYTAAGVAQKVPAADADGDGIADSFLFRVPAGTVNGIEYVAAIRVIDNGSAINAGTAWAPAPKTQAAMAAEGVPLYLRVPGDFFPSNVDLLSMIRGTAAEVNDQISRLDYHRLTGDPSDDNNTGGFPNYNYGAAWPGMQDNGVPRPDLVWLNKYDAYWHMVGRRLDNVGLWSPVMRYGGVSALESGVLAYKGGTLANLIAGSSPLERALNETLYDAAPNRDVFATPPPVASPVKGKTAYTGTTAVDDWYVWNFKYPDGLPYVHPNPTVTPDISRWNRRPLTVARNGIANLTVMKIATGSTGTTVTVPPTTPPTAGPPTGAPTITPMTMTPYAGGAVPRIGINTLGFGPVAMGTLWRGFWGVMAHEWASEGTKTPHSEQYWWARPDRVDPAAVGGRPGIPSAAQVPPMPPPAGPPASNPNWVFDPYQGSTFGAVAPFDPVVAEYHPARVFRSPLRGVRDDAVPRADYWGPLVMRLEPDQVLLLRSALAAVNAMDLRDTDDNVTSTEIMLTARGNDPRSAPDEDTEIPVHVRIHGNERQPFITEIHVNTYTAVWGGAQPPDQLEDPDTMLPYEIIGSNPNGYVAIELYNPHPFPIDIRYCRLAVIDRKNPPTGGQPTTAGGVTYPAGNPNIRHIENLYTRRRALPGTNGTANAHHDPTFGADLSPASNAERLHCINLAHQPLPANLDTTTGPLVDFTVKSNLQDATDPGLGVMPPTLIPPYGFLVLENYEADEDRIGNAAQDPRVSIAMYRPPTAGLPARGRIPRVPETMPGGTVWGGPGRNYAFVQNLDLVLGKELVLLRGPEALSPAFVFPDGTAAPVHIRYLPPVPEGTAEPINLAETLVPLDSFDFTGCPNPDPGNGEDPPSPAPDPLTQVSLWSYTRASGAPQAPTAGGKAWKFVYPGRYDGNKPGPTAASSIGTPRQQGTYSELWDPTAVANPWQTATATTDVPGPGPHLGGQGMPVAPLPNASYPREFPIQMSSYDSPGPFPRAAVGAPIAYPFGGFARSTEVTHIPYIGSYTISFPDAPASIIIEMNAVTMDAAFAEDTITSNDPLLADATGVLRREQVGRLVATPADLNAHARGTLGLRTGVPYTPNNTTTLTSESYVPRQLPPSPTPWAFPSIHDFERNEPAGRWLPDPTVPGDNMPYEVVITGGPGAGQTRTIIGYTPGTPTTVGQLFFFNDFNPPLGVGTRYEIRRSTKGWSSDLFDYFTVQNPDNDYLPNSAMATTPEAVSNSGQTANGADEQSAVINGLININTAPWPVLATIQYWQPGDNLTFDYASTPFAITVGGDGEIDNQQFARAIVAWRDREIAAGPAGMTGPFRSLYDLYRVPEMVAFSNLILTAAAEPDDEDGDISPMNLADVNPADGFGDPFTDGVRWDFEEQLLPLTRISNLITTRSDVFTNYILVQGWRGLDTTNPELVVQRRRAFISDRSGAGGTGVKMESFYNEE